MQEDYKTVSFGLCNDPTEECNKLKEQGYVRVDTVYNEFDPSYGYYIFKKEK